MIYNKVMSIKRALPTRSNRDCRALKRRKALDIVSVHVQTAHEMMNPLQVDEWIKIGLVLANRGDLRSLQSLIIALGKRGEQLKVTIYSVAFKLFMSVKFCQKCHSQVGNTYVLQTNRYCYLCSNCERSSKLSQKRLLQQIKSDAVLTDTWVWVTRNTLERYVEANSRTFIDVPDFMLELMQVIEHDDEGVRRFSSGGNTKFLLSDVLFKYGQIIMPKNSLSK